eukprot:3697156-Rhodomonas_salina.2
MEHPERDDRRDEPTVRLVVHTTPRYATSVPGILKGAGSTLWSVCTGCTGHAAVRDAMSVPQQVPDMA